MLDFSDAGEQRDFSVGPVPGGSIVLVKLEILQPYEENSARENPNIYIAKSGLRQIRCKFEVSEGSYKGVSFRQNIACAT